MQVIHVFFLEHPTQQHTLMQHVLNATTNTHLHTKEVMRTFKRDMLFVNHSFGDGALMPVKMYKF